MTLHAVIEHEVSAKYVNPVLAESKVQSADITKDLAMLKLEGATLGSDVTTYSGPPNHTIKRTVCLNLSSDFLKLYNTDLLREGRLREAFVGSISQNACADCKVTSIVIGEGDCAPVGGP